MNDLRTFNENLRKDVTYDNIKSHKKSGFHLLFRRYIFRKATERMGWRGEGVGVKLTLPADLGLTKSNQYWFIIAGSNTTILRTHYWTKCCHHYVYCDLSFICFPQQQSFFSFLNTVLRENTSNFKRHKWSSLPQTVSFSGLKMFFSKLYHLHKNPCLQ